MLSDPQSVTINSVAKSLPAISRGTNTSAYQFADGTIKLSISHSYAKRTRRQVRLDFSKLAADPLISAQNIKYSMSAYLVVDLPPTGFTVTEAQYIVSALTKWLTDSSAAASLQVLGGES